MPSPFYELSQRFRLRRLLGTSKVHDIGTGFQALGEDLDNINQGHQDFMQAGVAGSTSWSFTAAINSGTGALASTGEVAESIAWLPDPVLSGALMRTVTAKAAIASKALATGALPASGKYAVIAFELAPTTWGKEATVTTKAGAEYASAAEAEEHPPATTAGHTQVRLVVVKNTAGVYSIEGAQKDVRPWATGVANGQVYGAQTSRQRSTKAGENEYEPSASRPTLVVLEVAGSASLSIEVGGVVIASVIAASATTTVATFIVPAGKKWKMVSASPVGVNSSYLTL